MAVNNGGFPTYFNQSGFQTSARQASPSHLSRQMSQGINTTQYSHAQIAQMRQDAIRRTNELHSRSTNPHNTYEPQQKKAENAFTPQAPHVQDSTPTEKAKGTLNDILSALGLSEISGENAIILLLIVLLVKEKKSMKLVLALAYLLL